MSSPVGGRTGGVLRVRRTISTRLWANRRKRARVIEVPDAVRENLLTFCAQGRTSLRG